MAQYTLGQTAQQAVNTALALGSGQNNSNYFAAYQAIYQDLMAENSAQPIDQGVLSWFSLAGAVNSQQHQPTAAGTYIWNFTKRAAAVRGAVITVPLHGHDVLLEVEV